jgi:hypothetical protein
VEYSHGQKAECEAQMKGDGVFPPRNNFFNSGISGEVYE